MDLSAKIMMRDNDGKYAAEFDQTLEARGPEVKRNTPASPNLRAHIERAIQTLQVECLDKFVVVAERHLNHINREWTLHYNRKRPHSARGHLPPAWEPPESGGEVVCTTRLGGLLKSYSRRAA